MKKYIYIYSYEESFNIIKLLIKGLNYQLLTCKRCLKFFSKRHIQAYEVSNTCYTLCKPNIH